MLYVHKIVRLILYYVRMYFLMRLYPVYISSAFNNNRNGQYYQLATFVHILLTVNIYIVTR